MRKVYFPESSFFRWDIQAYFSEQIPQVQPPLVHKGAQAVALLKHDRILREESSPLVAAPWLYDLLVPGEHEVCGGDEVGVKDDASVVSSFHAGLAEQERDVGSRQYGERCFGQCHGCTVYAVIKKIGSDDYDLGICRSRISSSVKGTAFKTV